MPKVDLCLHVCCAPCLSKMDIGIVEMQLDWNIQHTVFYNPNIHPLLEFRKRQKAFLVYLERKKYSYTLFEEYGLKEFLYNQYHSDSVIYRCNLCYYMRLEKIAIFCQKNQITNFSTTLLASQQQNYQLIVKIGEDIAKKYNLNFLVADFRNIIPSEKSLKGIYKQQYCGCIFSEEERYINTNKELYKKNN